MAVKTLLKNAMILTLNEKDEILKNTDILIEDDEIKKIEKNIQPTADENVIDCTDLLLAPGFVNAHLHSDENMFKGKYDNMPLELWMLYSYPPTAEYGNFSERLVYLRTMIGAIEQIKSGVTCCQDDVSGHPRTTAEGHNIIFKAYKDLGMRANISTSALHKNFLDTIPYLRDFMPSDFQKKFANTLPPEEELKEAEQIIKNWNGKDNFKVTLSPIAPQRCDDDYNIKVFELAEKYDLPYHTHICETRMQRETGFEFYGKTILQHCKDIGILSRRTTIAHGNWLDDRDVEVMAETGATVVHNIVSNLKLGSGIMPFAKLKEAGVNIALGTDGTSSNDSQNIMEVMKVAALIHKATQPNYKKWPTSSQILNAATRGGAQSVMREKEIGSLAVGKKADILMFDLNTPAFTPLNDIKNHLVYCENGSDIKNVIIAGKMVMKDRKILTVDEKSIVAELKLLHEDFMKSYSKIVPFADKTFEYVNKSYWKCMNANDKFWRLTAPKSEYKHLFEN